MGDQDLEYGLPPGPDAYRDFELIAPADVVLDTVGGFARTLGLTDMVHSGPAGGIPIREEAYPDLKRFAEHVLPELKAI
jgi:hypothetical protein